MSQKMFLVALAAMAAAATSTQTTQAQERPVHMPGLTQAAAEVYAPIGGMSYTIGSNGFSGFFQQTDGKCALTLMLFKRTNTDMDPPDASAARVQVAIRPGENARVGSAEGEALELTCNSNAGTVTVLRSQIVPSQ